MNNDIRPRVLQVVSQVMNVADNSLNGDSSPDTISEWDSLKHINLVLSLEEEFGVQFSDEQTLELQNVDLIVLTVSELLG